MNAKPRPVPAEPLAVGAAAAARLLGVSRRTLWTYTNAGELPHARLGRRVLYPLAELAAWLERNTVGAT